MQKSTRCKLWGTTFFLILFFLPSLLPAEKPETKTLRHQFSISPFWGLELGDTRELVYSSNLVLSELLWPILPAIQWGLEGEYRYRDSFYFSASLNSALPGQTGSMIDRDWMNILSHPGNRDLHYLTHFSAHEAWLEQGLVFTARTGGKFPKNSDLQFYTGLAFSYRLYNWTATNGYTQYAQKNGDIYEEWQADLPKTPMYGPGINYRQQWLLFGFELGGRFPIGEKTDIGLALLLYPLAQYQGFDHHIKRDNYFVDSTENTLMFQGRIALHFELSAKKMFFTEFAYSLVPKSRGDTIVFDTNSGSYAFNSYKNGGGSGVRLSILGIACGLRIGL